MTKTLDQIQAIRTRLERARADHLDDMIQNLEAELERLQDDLTPYEWQFLRDAAKRRAQEKAARRSAFLRGDRRAFLHGSNRGL